MKQKRTALLLFQAKGATGDSCPQDSVSLPRGLGEQFYSSVQGGIAGEDQGVCKTCTPCIWPQVVS